VDLCPEIKQNKEAELAMTGENSKDFAAADRILARDRGWLKKNGTPNAAASERFRRNNRLTWHHHEDGETMQLIPEDLHGNITHSGGASLSRNKIN